MEIFASKINKCNFIQKHIRKVHLTLTKTLSQLSSISCLNCCSIPMSVGMCKFSPFCLHLTIWWSINSVNMVRRARSLVTSISSRQRLYKALNAIPVTCYDCYSFTCKSVMVDKYILKLFTNEKPSVWTYWAI